MQQMSSWKSWLFIGTLGVSLLAAPAWSQQPAPASVPGPGADAKAWVEYGRANGAKGDLDAAIEAFNKAVQIDPKYAPAYFGRGLAHTQQGKPEEALTDYDQTIQINPNFREAYFQRGSLKGQKGDFDGAISDLSQVLKLDPKYAQAYYFRGNARYFKGDLAGALQDLNQAFSLNQNSPDGYFTRGLIQHAQGHRAEALSDFQKSVGLNFAYGPLWVWIIEVENGQRDLARKDLSDALAKPELFNAGDWPSQIGNFFLDKITQDQLLANARTGDAARLNGRLCEAWFYAGVAKRLSGDTKGAQDCFASAISTESKSYMEFVEANREAAELQKP